MTQVDATQVDRGTAATRKIQTLCPCHRSRNAEPSPCSRRGSEKTAVAQWCGLVVAEGVADVVAARSQPMPVALEHTINANTCFIVRFEILHSLPLTSVTRGIITGPRRFSALWSTGAQPGLAPRQVSKGHNGLDSLERWICHTIYFNSIWRTISITTPLHCIFTLNR
jgi:hypothetical protein